MLTQQQRIAVIAAVFCIGACLTGYWAQRAATVAVATPSKCPNLSGRYMIQGEDGQVLIFIQQERCDRATIRRQIGYLGTWNGEKHLLKLDGTVQEDLPWFGETTERYKTSAKFNDSALHIEARNSGSTLAMIYSLTPQGDLLEEAVLNGRDVGGHLVAKRQR